MSKTRAHQKDEKEPWSRERWLFLFLALVFAALFVYGLATGGLAPEPEVVASDAPRAIDQSELALPTSDPAQISAAPSQPPPGARQKLDVNQADAWMLTAIPGVGAKLAERIVAYRDAQGHITSIVELDRVEGVGERMLENLKEYLEVR